MSSAPVMTQGRAAAVAAFIVAIGPVSMALYTPAMPTLVTAFGTTEAAVKLTLTAYFLGFTVTQLVCGPISDVWGRRPAVIGFMALYLVGTLMALFAPTIEVLIAARLVQGVGAAVGMAVSRAMVRDLFTGHQSSQVMNLIGLWLILGPAISPGIGGLTLEFLGWRAIFLLMAVYGAAILLAFLTIVPETLAEPQRSMRLQQLANNYLTLLGDPRFLRPALVIGLVIGTLYAMATILPFVLVGRVGLTPVQFGFVMLAQSGGFMIGSLLMRQLLKTSEAPWLVPVGLAVIVVSALLLFLGAMLKPNVFTVMGPICLLTFGMPFILPSMMTGALAPYPHMAGAASALSGFFQMGAGLLGSLVAAVLDAPVVALAAITPGMVLVALAAHFGLRGPSIRRQATDRRTGEPQAAE